MGLFDWLRGRRQTAAPVLRGPGAVGMWGAARPQARGWLAAQPSKLLADLPGASMPAFNRDLRWQLATLRARSRWLAQNEGHTAGFLKSLRRNVVGPKGFTLQMRVMNDRMTGPDADANARLEAAWRAWSRHGRCDVTGRLSFTDLCGLVLMAVARDGEALVVEHRGYTRNAEQYALEVLDAAQLDDDVNGRPQGLAPGHVVRAGVELDALGRPVAYHIRRDVPHDDPAAQTGRVMQRERVPAERVLHLFLPEWPHQVRGVPWISNGLRALAMLDGYGEAELTAARVAAAKMGFYTLDGDQEPDADLAEDGRLTQEVSAGQFELLPRGVDFKPFDPQHPNAAYKDFVSGMLRPIAAGVGLSYNAFANDAEGMNYSALRATELEDRDEFRTLQYWMIGAFCQRVFRGWLDAVLIAGVTGLPVSKAWKFDAADFVPRGWQWVDPLKEVAAAEKAVALGIMSRTQIVASQGGDIEAIAADLAREKEMLRDLTPAVAPSGAALPADDQEN
jgi:lambda family phage portal protein